MDKLAKKTSSTLLREKMPLRLGLPPKASSVTIQKVMKANKAKDTKPEIILRKALWAHDIRGYRLNWKKVPGTPDIVFLKRKIAIFVNGCFWHRCPTCNLSLPKTNTEFWETKFKRNIDRDQLKLKRLEELGWTVLVIWECQIKNDLGYQVLNVKNLISKSSY